jgi:predicted nucleic acid-binding protein
VIILDASYLVVLLHPSPAPAKDRTNKPVSDFKERVANLVALMDVTNDVIGIPAPAMAEVLVRAGTGRARYVTILSDRSKFQILPFDSRAAIEASELIAAIKSSKEPWATWAKVKFDIQIVSIARAESASVIYADDRDIENYAKRFKIPVMRICDLPVPPAPKDEPTFTPDSTTPVGEQQMLEGLKPAKVELPHEEKTSGPKIDAPSAPVENPAPVQGSDGGRAQGETARENHKEEGSQGGKK